MTEEQILKLWRSGYDKNRVAEIYKRLYNQQIKLNRLEPHNRHKGKLISSYDALARVEKIILNNLKMEGRRV